MPTISQQPETFGTWVRKRRKLLDLTQEDLAARASLSASAIRKIESDGRRPSRETADLLAAALQVAVDERDLFLRLARSGDILETAGDLPSLAALGEGFPSRPADGNGSTAHGLVPPPATIAAGDASDSTVAAVGVPQLAEVVVASVSRQPIPQPTLPIVGRAQEIAQISALLHDPQCRLLTVVGAGGMGKTRLALEVARRVEGVFRDGAVFVELSPLVSADYLPSAVAAALGLASATRTDPAAATLDYLARRELLLVLDNMEHLLAAAGFIGELIGATTSVKVLATSREHLNLLGEWVFEIQGLPVRKGNAAVAVDESAATTLFIQRARQADVSFQVDEERLQAIGRICTLLGGMPLAIELAASWVRVLSPQEILEEMSRSLDFLAANRRDLPLRHRSIRAVFDQSWSLLGEREQRTLRRLSLFRSSFSREAVREVADGSLGDISTLLAKSLLNHGGGDSATTGGTGSGRYRVHEMVRQFAREHLEQAEEIEDVYGRMLSFYRQSVEKGYAEALGDKYVQFIETLQTELDNLRLVLEWGFDHDPHQALLLFCALRLLWEQRSADEASEWMSRAILLCEQTPGIPDDLFARVLGMAAWVDRDHSQAAQRAERSVSLARAAGNERLVSTVLPLLGHAAIREGRPDESGPYFDEALEIAIRLDNPALEASVRNEVGKANRYLGFYERAREHHELARQSARQAGHPALQADASLNLNLIALRTGNFQQAQAWIEENLAISRAIGDRPAYGWALQSLVRCYVFQGHFDRAFNLLEQLRTFVEETPYRNQAENYYLQSGDYYLLRGDLETGERFYRKSLATAQDPLYRGWCYRGLGAIARFRHDWSTAIAYLNDAIAIAEATSERWNRSLCYIMLADVAHEMGDANLVASHLATAAALVQPLGDKWGMARWCESSARHALTQGDLLRAAQLLGAADALRDWGGSRRAEVELDRDDGLRTILMQRLGEDVYDAALRAGAEMAQDTATLVK